MLPPIAVGFDGSPESVSAADWAAREARLRGLPLHLVNAWPGPARRPGHQVEQSTQRYWAEQALRDAALALRELYPEVAVIAEQVPQASADALLAAAGPAEMLVLGSRGTGTVGGYLLGSVGLETLARAGGPVVLVRTNGSHGIDYVNGYHADAFGKRRTRDVVLGLSLKGDPERPTAFAFEAAASHGVALRAVHALSLPTVNGYASWAVNPSVMQEAEDAARQALVAALQPWRDKFPEVPLLEDVVLDSAALAVIEAAAEAELLVVGRRTHRPGRIGSVTHAAIHHARCPIAVVPQS